ncbi:hypothetical protein EVJ50_12650 [Synechococcus sp. RSCCF101]|uniref:hypothetical protein n=1 Tax=Synechococcus sp. RSCCF101 TaxID=2511069 RepID=UPI0012456306|nr:hypothetical protein [Synechococcus sp. RSCCF101]QEY32947.1 hypothetical protein EVJ50_12650 [Synechococcus sp. RSCCF101]
MSSDAIALTLGQKFEVERMTRAIDATLDANRLQEIAKQLLMAWQTQKAATQWVVQQQLGSGPAMSGEAISKLGDPQGLA